MNKYGLPYMGSKNTIADKIIHVFPSKKRFYDLFCGGGAVSHAALLSGKYQEIIINDIDEQIPKLFVDALNGNLRDTDRWIGREEFNEIKDDNALIRIVWSFGNKGTNYLYGKDVEEYKRAFWKAVFDDDFSGFWELGINIPKIKGKSYRDKKLKIQSWAKKHTDPKYKIDKLQSFDALSRIKGLRLGSSEKLSKLKIHAGSYDKVEIKDDSIIYCDIPYENTAEYIAGAFNHRKFYDWAYSQKQLVIISSYNVSDKRFKRIINFNKNSQLQGGTGSIKKEGLFIADYNTEEWGKYRNV